MANTLAVLDNIEMRLNDLQSRMTTELDLAQVAANENRPEDGLRHIANFDRLRDEALTVGMEIDFIDFGD